MVQKWCRNAINTVTGVHITFQRDDIILNVREEAAENGKLFAQEIGCYDGVGDWNESAVFTCLANKTAREIFEAHVTG